MGDTLLLDEIDDLKEVIDGLKNDYQLLQDERDRQVEDMTAQVEKIKEKTESEWKMRLKAADREARERAEVMMMELDMMRQAFSGETGGWELVESKNAPDYYKNTETGEVRETEPEVLFIARSMQKVEEAKEVLEECDQLRKKVKDLEAKNKEMTLTVNKIKTEVNSLKNVDKSWKECSKVVFRQMTLVSAELDAQTDQILRGLTGVSKASRRVHLNVPKVDKCKENYVDLKARVRTQEEMLMAANAKVRALTMELEDSKKRVARLTDGLEEEVERIVMPIRNRLSDCMVLVMKEKAERAQERRELADIWPDTHMLPSMLLHYRTLNKEERAMRVKKFHDNNANYALSLEIRANVAESKKWVLEYDSYGRPFYKHTESGETSEEEPAIIKYEPPPGRDVMGNIVEDKVEIGKWTMMTDAKGRVFFKKDKTGEISYIPPYAYPKIPTGKTKETMVAEAAQLVLGYIKDKIASHIQKMNTEKDSLEHPLTAAERKKKEEKEADAPKQEEEVEEDGPFEASKIMYDIESIEYLASILESPQAKKEKDEMNQEEYLAQKSSFLQGSEVRSFDKEFYVGPTLLETDVTDISVPQLRNIIEGLAVTEERLDLRLARARDNLRDFSYVLMERLIVADKEKAEALRIAEEEQAKARKEEMRKLRIEAKRAARRKKREEEAEAKAKMEELAQQMAEAARQERIANGEEPDILPAAVTADGEGAVVGEGAAAASSSSGSPRPPNDVAKQGEDAASVASDAKKEVVEGGGAQDSKGEAPDVSGDKSVASGGEQKSLGELMDEAEDKAEEDAERARLRKENGEGGDDDEDASSETSELTGVEDMPYVDESGASDVLIYGDVGLDPGSVDFPLDIMKTSSNLSNFALFCGYANLRIDEAPDDANLEFSLVNEEGDEKMEDDKWLSSSFFLTVTMDKVDAVREFVAREYDPMLGLLNSSPLATARLMQAAGKTGNEGVDKEKPYTPNVKEINGNLTAMHAMWRSQQLMAEVLRFQFQQAAVREAYYNRFKNVAGEESMMSETGSRRGQKMTLMPQTAAIKARLRPIVFSVRRIIATNISTKVWADQQLQFIQLSLGGWATRTTGQMATGRPLVWDDLEINAILPLERVQLDDFSVEAFEEHSLRANVLLASARQPVNHILGSNTGSNVTFEFDLRDSRNSPAGTLSIIVSADYQRDEPEHAFDADQLVLSEHNVAKMPVESQFVPMLEEGNEVVKASDDTMLIQKMGGGVIALDLDSARSGSQKSNVTGKSLAASVKSGGLASQKSGRDGGSDAGSLRSGKTRGAGGGSGSAGQLAGASLASGSNRHNDDDALSGVFNSLADQQSTFEGLVADLRGDGCNFIKQMIGDVTLNDVLRVGHRINDNITKPLPSFKKAAQFLQKRNLIHEKEVELCQQQIDEIYIALDAIIEEKFVLATEAFKEGKLSYKKLIDGAEDTRLKVKNITEAMEEVRHPQIRPAEPILPDLPDVAYVVELPEKGGLDARGKKKKQVPNNDLKAILEGIEAGNQDATDWDFGNFWPTQAQAIKINKARADRNVVLDEKRKEEIDSRNRLMKGYVDTCSRWELDEKARKKSFDKIKKDSRKSNLKLDCFMERADQRMKMLKAQEFDEDVMKQLRDLHVKSKDRLKIMRLKQYMEKERQKESMMKLRKRLLKAIDARKRALELPRGATNPLQFEELRTQAEEALRTLRIEVFECKQLLVNEGVRLRTMRVEEQSVLRNEHIRCTITLEMLRQKEDMDKILERYQYEVLHLMEAMEKLRLIEADKDDRGQKDTVDNLGERYIPGKKWESQEIIQCQNLIDLVMAKLSLTENLAISSSKSSRCIMAGIMTKWGSDFIPTRDSWVENSDYERAQQLLGEIVTWVSIQRQKLGYHERQMEQETMELRLQVAAADQQAELMLRNQESDTRYVTESALNIVNVMQSQIGKVREKAKVKEDELDLAITDVSRECQKIREELMNQAQANDEKEKLLWAVIATLQTATQSLTARMEIIISERDKIVITSKLEGDKMKQQLRQERKHCSNLLFIIHSQRGSIKYLQETVAYYTQKSARDQSARKRERSIFRKEIWEQIFCFTRLSTDVDALFEFFAARMANLAGARKSINEQLARNGASYVLSALCRSPRPLIRKYAARALGGLGWDGYVETRILMWDCVLYWKIFKTSVLLKESKAYDKGFSTFAETGKFEALLTMDGAVDEFVPSGNMSLRTIIKQRRQWALRVTRRNEGPNSNNQKLINVRDGAIPALLDLVAKDGEVDWEIPRNAALAISIASFEMSNHHDMTNDQRCVRMLIRMCTQNDAEVQTHAAVTIANLCHKDEHAQAIFGNSEAIPALISMCSSNVVDVLEGATSALANITCFCDPNCERVMQAGGVAVMVRMVTAAYSENLLDLDQNDEVQANAAEMLANVSRVNSEFTIRYFDAAVVDAVVLMCAAVNKQVKRHAPLVLGNVGQSEECRQLIGMRGGIEALFLVLEDEDKTIQANTLWALCNLMWSPPNQERAGRFMSEIIKFLSYEWLPIKTHACILLANVLYYNNTNRVRFLESDGAMELLIEFIQRKEDPSVVEACLRAVLALAYLDNVALWLGTDGDCVPLLLSLMVPPYISSDTMRYSLEIMSNLCVHHINRHKILESGGIEVIVSLQSDSDIHIQKLSVQIIEYLEDVTPAEVLAKAKSNIGIERMIVLATNADPIVRAVAAESIGEEVWHNPKLQNRALEVGGVDVLLAILNNADEAVGTVLPALWSLRNLLHNNTAAQAQLAHRDGLLVLTKVLSRGITGQCGDQTEKILEAALACMASAIANQERNSRRLLIVGLEALMDLADGKIADAAGALSISVKGAMKAEGVVALSKSILLMLGPYNYIVCRNCQKKQDLMGTSCYSCGHRLRVEVNDDRGVVYKVSSAQKPSSAALPLASQTAPPAFAGMVDKALMRDLQRSKSPAKSGAAEKKASSTTQLRSTTPK